MGYSAKAVANYFLSKYGKHGITPLKVQKLVYLAHGWHMAFYEDPLVADEDAEAWRYGPVFPSLYHEFKYRGRMPILKLARDMDFEDFKESEPKIEQSDGSTMQLLDKVWDVYGKHSGIALSEICHQDGSPWAETWGPDAKRNAHIPEETIRKYFKDQREKNLSRGGG